jgi:hypothetical protein
MVLIRLSYTVCQSRKKKSLAWGIKEDLNIALDEDTLTEPVLLK